MANLNRKERRAQRNESNTIGILLRLFFGLSFIGLAVVLFGELDLNYVFSIFTADIIVSLIYVILNKSRITTSLAVNTNVRVIIAFLIMLVTMFFYAFALWRVNQFSAPMQVTLFIGGAIVYLAVFNSTKTMLTNQDWHNRNIGIKLITTIIGLILWRLQSYRQLKIVIKELKQQLSP